MKKALSVLALACAALSAAAPPAHAQTTSSTRARWYDVQRLQDDLAVLDDSLATVPTNHPRYREFQTRADALRSDLARLRDDMERSGNSRDLPVSAAEVNRLRTRIRELQNDIDTSLNRRWTGTGSVVLPEGTELTVRLERPLSSRTARVEDRVEATLARPVNVDGRMVVPAGARVLGTVTQVEPAQKPVRGGRLNIAFDRLLLVAEVDERERAHADFAPDAGTTVDLRTRVVQVKEDIVNSETAKRGAIGAALGAVLGKVLGGTKGALIGILLGGAGGVITAQGDDVELPEGTVFTLQLERPATVLRR